MLNKQDRIQQLKDELSELESSIDLFGDDATRSWDWVRTRNFHTPRFGRDPSLDDDLVALVKKYKGKPQEILVRHMIDSLIIFNHNRAQVDYVNTGDKFGDTEVWKAIQVQLNS